MISELQIEAAVKQMFEDIVFPAEPAGLYEPLRYMLSIGGKRIRPTLCLTAYSAFRDRLVEEDVTEAARALEIFHSFTLLHDDIMDNSPLRRGKETVWKKWGQDTAILSGDAMYTDSIRRMSRVPHKYLDRVLDIFERTAIQVMEGQQYDMDFENRDRVSMEEYNTMIGLKTAALLACSAEIGAVLAGAGKEAADAMSGYGYELGMAFQIADDYLDAFGDEKVFGKPIGGDILNGKKSWLTVRACEKSADKPAFLRALGERAVTEEEKGEKIATVKNIYCELGVDTDASAEIERHSALALEAISGLRIGSLRQKMLRRFAENLVGRAK